MCGIAGVINKNGSRIEEDAIRRMMELIKHRGPDAEGVYINGSYGVGHRRLSIVDLSEDGRQPMGSHDGRYVVSFNGEIYNYVELKAELEGHGCKFRTRTDTEVILEAYRLWGWRCARKFNGMWAFALYDVEEQELFLSRDRFGVKPLYILDKEECLVFASEIKCILELYPEERLVNETAVARYFGNIQEDGDSITFYRNIENFPKATNMVYDLKSNKKVVEIYWRIDKDRFRKKYGGVNAYRKFREILEDAVRIRLRADVPVGASLSGGLDSSAIVSIVKKKFGVTMNTFSSIYEEEDCNEEEFISCVNGDAGAIPHYIYPEKSTDMLKDLKEMMYYHDGPCESASPYSGFCVYRGVKKDVTVMLDGQGADELFGGYLDSIVVKLQDLIKKNHRFYAARLIGDFQEAIPMYRDAISENMLVEALGYRGYRAYAEKKGACKNPRENAIANDTFTEKYRQLSKKIVLDYPKGVHSEVEKLLYRQLTYSGLPRILHDVDRNSMAHSLEVRLPFLDYRLVEFSHSLADHYKVRGSWTKYVMRRALKKYLPKKIYSRRNKMGLPAPFDVWLRDEKYKDRFKEYIVNFGERGIMDKEKAVQLYERHLNGQRLEGLLFKMISFEMWLEDYIDTENKKWKLEVI